MKKILIAEDDDAIAMIKKKFAEKDRDHSKEEGAQNQTRKAGWVHFSLLLFE